MPSSMKDVHLEFHFAFVYAVCVLLVSSLFNASALLSCGRFYMGENSLRVAQQLSLLLGGLA